LKRLPDRESFIGNVCAPLEDGLARLIRVRQHRSIDVDHDLVSLCRRAGIHPVVQGCLREQGERIRPLLRHGRRLRGRVRRMVGCSLAPALLVQRLAGCSQCVQEERADFRRQPSADDYRAVLVLVDVQRAACVLPLGLPRLGVPIDSPAAPHDPLDVGGGPG
jgi:hypothetical protein